MLLNAKDMQASHFIFHTLQHWHWNIIVATTVQKLDVPGPDEKFCLSWLCAFTKFSSGGAIFPVHLIFEHLYMEIYKEILWSMQCV